MLKDEIKRFENKSVITRNDRVQLELIIEELTEKIKKLTGNEVGNKLQYYRELINKCKKIKEGRSSADERSESSEEEEQHTTKMAKFNYDTAIKLESLSEVDYDKAKDFIASVKTYHNTLDADGKKTLCNFVLSGKIKGAARTQIGDEAEAETLDEVKKLVFEAVLSSDVSESLQSQLISARQGRKSLNEYVATLESLADRLAWAVSREQNLDIKITKEMAKKLALNQFKSGCHREVQNVVMSSRPKTLQEALRAAKASNLDEGENFSMNHFTHRRQNNGNRGRGGQHNYNNRNFNGNTTYRNNNNFNGNNRNWNNNGNNNFNNNNRGWSNNYRGNNRQNNNTNYRNSNRNHNDQQNSNRNYNGQQNNNQHGQHSQQRHMNHIQEQQPQQPTGNSNNQQSQSSQRIHMLGN